MAKRKPHGMTRALQNFLPQQRPQPETNIVQVIADAVRDPQVDPAKAQGLLELYRELERDVDRREFARHMSLLQSEISQIAADAANPQTHSRYASYPQLDRALRPFYTAHGFSVSFTQEDHPGGADWVRVVCVVTWGSHESRHRADVRTDQLGPKGNKVMTATHASASAISYGKRYALAMAFNVVVSRDDDGNAAGQQYVTQSQLDELLAICAKHKLPVKELCAKWEIEGLSQVPRSAFNKTKTHLFALAERQSKATEKETAE